MAIDPKKILTISATEYCIITHQRLEDFIVQGVDYSTEYRVKNIKKDFARSVPYSAKVVVGYRNSISISQGEYKFKEIGVADGTALIPKNGN